jgi:hypothetical protein
VAPDEQEAIKLHYINKVQDHHVVAGHKADRVLALQLTFAAIILAFVSGVITVDHRLSFGGSAVIVSVPLLLLMLAVATAALQCYDAMLSSLTKQQRDEVTWTYASVGFAPEHDPTDLGMSPLEYPSVGTIVSSALNREVFDPWMTKPFAASLPMLVQTHKGPRGLLARVALAFIAMVVLLLLTSVTQPVAELLAVGYALGHHGISWLGAIAIVVLILVPLNVVAWMTYAPRVSEGAQQAVHTLREVVQAALRHAQSGAQSPQSDRGPDVPPSEGPGGASPG